MDSAASTSSPGPRQAGRTGPRTGTDTRTEIRAAAARLFAERGFRATTMRAVAERAGVDVALISYYFGNKEGLFTATMDLPVDPRTLLTEVFAPGLDGVGERLARTMVRLAEDDSLGRPLVGVVRTLLAEDPVSGTLRDFFSEGLLEVYAELIGAPDARRRATLAASQVMGVAVLRYVLRIEPVASMSADELVGHIGPTLQRYLDGTG